MEVTPLKHEVRYEYSYLWRCPIQPYQSSEDTLINYRTLHYARNRQLILSPLVYHSFDPHYTSTSSQPSVRASEYINAPLSTHSGYRLPLYTCCGHGGGGYSTDRVGHCYSVGRKGSEPREERVLFLDDGCAANMHWTLHNILIIKERPLMSLLRGLSAA